MTSIGRQLSCLLAVQDLKTMAIFAHTLHSTNVGQIIVRGIAMGHVSYGFLMGYFRGKGMKTGNGFYRILACVLPWAMHALYNFSLSPVVAGNDFFTFTAVTLAALDVIIWVFFVLKLRKWRDSIEFTLPLWDLQ